VDKNGERWGKMRKNRKNKSLIISLLDRKEYFYRPRIFRGKTVLVLAS
jgi:hypothetical protein